MKRFLPVILALNFTLCCLPFPALAAEDRGFSDVSPEDWFAPYVEVCVEEGLMKGTGDGKFGPQRELTLAEVMVLAARLCSQVMEEEIPSVPLGEALEPDNILIQLWPFFVEQEEIAWKELEPTEILSAMNRSEQAAIADFLNQLTADPSPYSWYLNEVYYLWEQQNSEMEELARRLQFQPGTAANTPASRKDFGTLTGWLTPSPIAIRAPEEGTAIDSQGARILIMTGVMEGTGEGYALEKSLTRAECAALLARMMDPGLRKTPAVVVRPPEELTGLEIQHGSFGQIESKYTIDLGENTLTCWHSGYFQETEDRQETLPLDRAAIDAFRQSQAAESLMGWGPVYYNMGVFDGHQWSVKLTFSDGAQRDIFGSNAYPEGWDLVYDSLLELTGKSAMDVRSNWLDR